MDVNFYHGTRVLIIIREESFSILVTLCVQIKNYMFSIYVLVVLDTEIQSQSGREITCGSLASIRT